MNFSQDLSLGMESRPLYQLYYRRAGIRMPMQLIMPVMSSIADLQLPLNSLLHYVPEDESVYGIPQDDPIVRGEERLIMVEHITQLADTRGNPIPIKIPPGQMTRAYHRKYRKTRPLLNFQAANGNPRTLIVENYALLPHMARYLNNFFRPFSKWWNIQATVWDRVGKIAAMSDRQQYLECRLPPVLPTLPQLTRAESAQTRVTLEPFRSPESLFLLEFWKWLGAHRAESVIAKCPESALDKMNLIFIEGDRWFVMNLGLLNSWRKSESRPDAPMEQLQLQKRFLRLMMTLLETRSVASATPVTTILPEVAPAKDEAAEQAKAPSDVAQAPAEPAPTLAKDEPLTAKVPTESGRSKKIEVFKGVSSDALPENEDQIKVDFDKIEEQIESDLRSLEVINDNYEKALQEGRISESEGSTDVGRETARKIEFVNRPPTLEEGVMNRVNELAEGGLLSAGEYRRFMALSSSYKELPNPYNPNETLEAAMRIDPSSLIIKDASIDRVSKIPDKATVIDKSMLNDTLKVFDNQYIDAVLKKDMLNVVTNLQQTGVAITGYEVEEKQDAINRFEVHTINLTPVQGKPSTVKFMVPKVNSDGTFLTGNVKSRLRKARRDVPIRKVSPSKVALTSYYSKIFVARSEKQVNSYSSWLTNQIAAMGMDAENATVTHLMLANVFDSTLHVPRAYSTLAARFRSFHLDGYDFFFDYHARLARFGEDAVNAAEHDGVIVVGSGGKQKRLVVMDRGDFLYEVTDGDLNPIGTFESLLGLDGKSPLEMIELKVFGKLIPIGVLLAYKLGFTQLLKVMQAPHRIVPVGERLSLSSNEFPIRFENETYVINRDNRTAAMVLAGFTGFENFTRNYSAHLFDKSDIYLNLLESANIGIRYLRELDLMTDLFIDPITREILEEMKEPTTFVGLLFRACELLQTDWSPDETDLAYMRIVGYERIPGMVYGELVKSMRVHKARGGIPNAKIDLHPYVVWQTVTQDSSVKIVEDSNPINCVKEKEEVTYSGEGGRSDRSMVGRTRIFHKSDLGTISEATKDSSQVAVTTYLTSDPNLTNLRGLTSRYEPGKSGSASTLSSSAMLAVTADRDEMRRTGFVSIQNSSSTFAKGYRAAPLRTGYEQVIASRTDDLFAATAKQNGKVSVVTERAITVTYEDGSTQSIQLGRRFGTVAAMTLPHEIKTPLKVGDDVKAGDILTYNSHYFDLDPLNPTTAVFKFGCLLTVALMESPDTLEDSCAISEHAADLLQTQTSEIRNIVVSFKDTIHGLAQVGSSVVVEDILCTIEDPVTAQSHLFDETSIDTLRLLAASSPRAKVKGVVEKIEVFYNGDFDDLSPSLQDIVQESDRNRKRLARDLRVEYASGRVDGSLNIEGHSLAPDTAVIRVHITSNRAFSVGD